MKVIFLDFDGVITIPPKWYLQANLIKNVKKIVDATEAKIVVSSSWRMDTVEETVDTIIGRTKRCPRNKMLYWLIDNIYDVTHTYKGLRGQEIMDWLDEHDDVDNYVIIDDDNDFYDEQLYHFVQTNYEDGLTEVETKRAIKVLNKLYFQNSMALNFELRFEYLKKCHCLPGKYDDIQKYNDLCKDMNNRYEDQ
jgi:hypothetical protein